MGKKGKKGAKEPALPAPAATAEAAPDAPPEIPLSTAPLPLLALQAELLGEFLELCFPDRRLLELCGELRLYSPGYRLENLPPNQVARMLADEARAAKDAEALLEKAVREALRNPVHEGGRLRAEDYRDLLELFTGDPLQHVARIAWRALLEEDAGLRDYAAGAIDLGVEMLDASAKKPGKPRKPPPPADVAQAQEEVKRLRAELDEAGRRAERAEKERAAVREQLAQARAETAAREKALGEERDHLGHARAELTRLQGELQRLTDSGAVRALSEARRAADEARSLEGRVRTLQEELAAAEARAQAAERRLSAAAQGPQPAQPAEEDLPSAEEASTFLVPIFTREFYDSIGGWDRRMQRAAFDKVALLARDWRHGSLRAIALEGLPGYYRIRVATDVRLIYRRGEGNALEILSLIDREDLDRYVRQARTRPA